MVDWLLFVWEAQPKTPAMEESQKNWDGYLQTFIKEFGDVVVKPLKEALVSLGRTAEAWEVERTFRTMSVR